MGGARIFCYGDSLTAGTRGISYVERLNDVLPAHAECLVRGLRGATATDLARAYPRLAPAAAIDLLILTVGTNEALAAFSPRTLRMLRRVRGRPVVVEPADFEATLLRWLGPHAARVKIVFCGLALASREGRLQERARALDAALKRAAARLGGAFIDMHVALAPHLEAQAEPRIPFSRLRDSLRSRIEDRWGLIVRPVAESAITFDGVHFAPRGAELYARAVQRVIEPILQAHR